MKPIVIPVVRFGDAVAAIAQPVAKVIDTVVGTKIASCDKCKQAQEQLNAGVPVIQVIKQRFQKEGKLPS